MGVLAHVGERLLDDAEEHRLVVPRQPALLAHHVEAGGQGALVSELLDELAQGGNQAQIVQGHGPEVEDQVARLLQRIADPGLEVGEFLDHQLGIAGQQALEDLRLEHQVGHRLGRTVVHVAGDPHPLLFDDLENLSRGAAEAGGLLVDGGTVQRRQVIERSQQSGQELALLTHLRQPRGGIADPLLQHREVTAQADDGLQRSVDVIRGEAPEVVDRVAADDVRLVSTIP